MRNDVGPTDHAQCFAQPGTDGVLLWGKAYREYTR